MPVLRRMVIAVILIVACALGCGQEPTGPVTRIAMSLGAAPARGSPASPVKFNVSVTNAGDRQVWRCAGCTCGNGVAITVLGPDGNAVILVDPKGPRPLCVDNNVPFPPGETLTGGTGGTTFTGTLYDGFSPTYPTPTYAAPAGKYTVIATFTYRTGSGETVHSIQKNTAFDWQP